MSECGIHAFTALHGELLCFSDVTGLKAARLERRILHSALATTTTSSTRAPRKPLSSLRAAASAPCVVLLVSEALNKTYCVGASWLCMCAVCAIRRESLTSASVVYAEQDLKGDGRVGRVEEKISQDRKGRTPLTPLHRYTPNALSFCVVVRAQRRSLRFPPYFRVRGFLFFYFDGAKPAVLIKCLRSVSNERDGSI